MSIYIAYRNLRVHYAQNNGCGGAAFNNDYKFTGIKDDIYYLLTQNNTNYAVSKEDGERFIEDVMNKCTGEHPGFFPFVPSINGKETAAVIERTRDVDNGRFKNKQIFYYDMDDEVLLGMLDSLRAGCGDPLNERELMNYCYPNSVLPEDDFDLEEIYHGIYCTPDNTPNSVVRTIFPDKKVSYFSTGKHGAFIQMRVDNNNVYSKVPEELISEIKDKVRQLCKEPAEAYVEHGDWESYIRFDNDRKRIFTAPDKTLELLNEIASKSEFDRTEAVDTSRFYAVNKLPAGAFFGMGMMGIFGSVNGPAVENSASPTIPAAVPEANTPATVPDGNKCLYCGADVTGKKFCTECGGKVGE